jgi:hypothetical protein
VSDSLARRLADLTGQLAALPEAEEPPPTTLQILGREGQERDWQRLLFHFLTPDEAHGLDHAFLEHLLAALSNRPDLTYTFSRFDLDDVRTDLEVVTAHGRPDALVWSSDDWFICWELKVDAAEGDDQTRRYVDIESFGGTGLETRDVPSDGRHYVYLAPDDAAPPAADQFAHVSWEWLASEIQSFLVDGNGAYPARTTAQLDDFAGTIRNQLTMTEYEENQREKTELYVDNYEAISAVQTAFEERWAAFAGDWGTRLARVLEAAEVVSDPDVPDEYVSVDLPTVDDARRRWTFRQGHDDWAWLFPDGWWQKLDDDTRIYDTSKPNARVGFLHRLDRNRQEALADHTLVFYLRNAPSGHETFYDGFARRFNAAAEIPDLLPAATSRPGVKSNVLEAAYDIHTDSHDDFFEAYLAALARAVDDHVVSNPALVETVDRLYAETIDEDVSL